MNFLNKTPLKSKHQVERFWNKYLQQHPQTGGGVKKLNPGPFFFHGFLRPISRAREIENDAFHGHFTG